MSLLKDIHDKIQQSNSEHAILKIKELRSVIENTTQKKDGIQLDWAKRLIARKQRGENIPRIAIEMAIEALMNNPEALSVSDSERCDSE